MSPTIFRDRLMVGHKNLTLVMVVRIYLSEPFKFDTHSNHIMKLEGGGNKWTEMN